MAGMAVFGGFTGTGGNLLAGTRESFVNSMADWHNVREYGVVGDGLTLNTSAIQTLIDKVSENGGGTLFFPVGKYITGTIALKKNITIHLSVEAYIIASKNKEDYNYGCLIYAEDAENITICGRGVIDGSGTSFWGHLLGKTNNEGEAIKNISWRPGRMIQVLRCENFNLEGIILENSPAWTVHLIDCNVVKITGISILNGVYEEDGPNTDGINPDGCSNVIISDSYIRCGDDCIVLKITTRSQRKKCNNVVVTNCILQTKETALKIGTETHGEFRNVTFSNCAVFDSGCCFGLWMRDGGTIDGVSVSNITMDCERMKNGQGIFIWSHRRTDDTPWGIIKNVMVSNMNLKSGGGIFIQGVDEQHIEGFTLSNIKIQLENERSTPHHENPPYPFSVFGHRNAPYDIYCRFVDNLVLRNIELTWGKPENPDWGGAIRCNDISRLEIDGFQGHQALDSDAPVIRLKNVENSFIHNCRAVNGTRTFLFCDKGTRDVSLMNNDLHMAANHLETTSGVSVTEVFESGNRLPAS